MERMEGLLSCSQGAALFLIAAAEDRFTGVGVPMRSLTLNPPTLGGPRF